MMMHGPANVKRFWSWSHTTTKNAPTTTFQGWCSNKLLMMGVEPPETCWGKHKHQVINLWNGCIWLFNLFELYDDARNSQSQAFLSWSQTTTNNAATTMFQGWCSCKLLMMGVEAPETCWAKHKRHVIKLWKCCIWLVNLFESYDEARTC
jgi:hypothetical protein